MGGIYCCVCVCVGRVAGRDQLLLAAGRSIVASGGLLLLELRYFFMAALVLLGESTVVGQVYCWLQGIYFIAFLVISIKFHTNYLILYSLKVVVLEGG